MNVQSYDKDEGWYRAVAKNSAKWNVHNDTVYMLQCISVHSVETNDAFALVSSIDRTTPNDSTRKAKWRPPTKPNRNPVVPILPMPSPAN